MTLGEQANSDLFEAMSTQRAIRYWKPDPVPTELLWKLSEMATRAPSGSNQQPWRFIFVTDPAKVKAIADAVAAKYQENDGLRNYFQRGATSEDRGTRLMLTGANTLVQDLAKAPVMVIPVMYREGAPAATSLTAGSSIYTAVQNLLLAARGLGLGSVMTTFQTMVEQELRDILGLPENAVAVAMLPLGYPAVKFGPVKRKPVEEVTYFNSWGNSTP